MPKLQNARWYLEPKGEAHTPLLGVFQQVLDDSEWRIEADELHVGFYKLSERHLVRGDSLRNASYEQASLPYNVCRSAVDTLQAKIAKHRPLPQVLAQRGDWSAQKRARRMTEFLEGEFYRHRIYEGVGPKIVRDALITGRGVLRVWVDGDKVRTERVLPWELLVDEWDARYGSPRNLFHVRSVDRSVALEAFARTESGGWNQSVRRAIEEAGSVRRWHEVTDVSSSVDRIDLIEAYHLCDDVDAHVCEGLPRDIPEGDDAEDPADGYSDRAKGRGGKSRSHKCTGRRVVFTTAGTVLDEVFEDESFPYVVLNYNEPVVGWYGTGLVEQVEGYQYQINETASRVEEQYRLSGVHILVPDNAKISYNDIRNGINIIGHQPGGKPEVHHMDLVNEHMRQRPRELREDALNDAGVSQMSAQSQKPAGIQSGVALQTLDDIETERFIIFGRAYEAWNLELARKLIKCAKQVAESYGDYAVSVPMSRGILKLKWTDVYVDGVELRVFPTSLLPQQLPARLQRLTDLWEQQIIDRATFLRHLDAPDLQAEMDLETADKLVIDEMIDAMLDADESQGDDAYMPPTAYQPFDWAARRAQQKYNRGLLDGAPEYNLSLLRRYIQHCEHELKKLAPPPMPAGPAMPPEAPPQAGMV